LQTFNLIQPALVSKSPKVLFLIGNDRVDIFYQVANPSIWMYYFPDPSTN